MQPSKLKITLPEGFSWKAHWENYLDSVRRIAAIAKEHGLRVALENHANVMSPQVDSLLRLLDHVPEDNLGVNLDIGWTFIQREDVPWAIHKLGDKLFHIHARDGDGLMCYRLPIGQGILDWPAIGRAADAVGFDGYLSVELSHQELTIEEGRERVRRVREARRR
ncbi:MAG: sugar phosphate isomerase/epimerase family protein [Bauldia sp.]